MLKVAAGAAGRILRKRTLPALFLYSLRGKLEYYNPAAEDLLSRGDSAHLLKSLKDFILKAKKRNLKDMAGAISPLGLMVQETVSHAGHTYGMKAFLLNHDSVGDSPLMAILIERVTTSRFNLDKAKRQYHLSPREVDVIQDLMVGMSDKEIASHLGIGFETVRDYLKKIRQKLGVSNRTGILSVLLQS